MKIKFDKERVQVTKSFEGDNFELPMDKIHMTNVIYNLLDNAVKYCKVDPQIELRTIASNGSVELSISDNGIGIAESDKSKIFDRFYRVSTGNQHNIKGYGLGLSYVASVVNKHGGTIKVESTPEKGSTFKIKLKRDA